MNRRQLCALARRTLRELDLKPPLDVDLLRVRLGERRGKPIDVIPSAHLAGYRTFGITGSSSAAECDVIMYEARTTWIHQMMIILHEFAHMICAHPAHAIDHSYRALADQEFREISPQALAEVLGNRRPRGRLGARRRRASSSRLALSLYDHPVEWEAETMATIMIEWVPGCGGYVAPLPDSPMQAILGDVTGW